MTKRELDIWFKYQKALKNNTSLEEEDWEELIRLNHLVMETSHEIHNNAMLIDLLPY